MMTRPARHSGRTRAARRCIYAKKGSTLTLTGVSGFFIVKQRLVSIVALIVLLAAAQPGQAAPRFLAALHLSPHASLTWYLAGFELGPWEQYLVSEITPELERLSQNKLPPISWLQLDEAIFLPEFAVPLVRKPDAAQLRFSFRQVRSSLLLSPALANHLGEAERFEQSMIMPGIVSPVSPASDLTVSAVLAQQRFGAPMTNLRLASTHLGAAATEEPLFNPLYSEVVQGTGLRFALSSEPVSGVRLEAAFQSRINMDEFASMRGVHGASAQLDIPPRLQVGLEMHATERSWLNIGVAQVFYSDISAFPSRSLPARFTALLGDHNSPDFAWSDLTVWNLGWRWQTDEKDLELYLDYRTRTQPRPTAPALAAMLDSELASRAILAGMTKALGQRSRFNLSASWAPPEYAFGGNLLGVLSDELGQDLEVQAQFSLSF